MEYIESIISLIWWDMCHYAIYRKQFIPKHNHIMWNCDSHLSIDYCHYTWKVYIHGIVTRYLLYSWTLIAFCKRLIAFRKRLIAFRKRLIAFRKRLIGFRKRLIAFRKRLIAFRKRLIGFRKRLIAFLKRLIGFRKRLIAFHKRLIAFHKRPCTNCVHIVAFD